MTYAFGRIHGLGNLPWHQTEVSGQAKMVGNPSVSDTVSSYMVSLRRQKVSIYLPISGPVLYSIMEYVQVHAGETATSSRAITPVRCFLFGSRTLNH